MPIKNYTSTVPANRSITEIQDALVKHGASGFMLKYEEERTGRISACQFILPMPDPEHPDNPDRRRPISFALPVEWRRFQEVLRQQKVSKARDEDYVYRVAWRCIRDWVLAQMALYETQIVELPQIFLPFAVNRQGNTLYEQILGGTLQLESPRT